MPNIQAFSRTDDPMKPWPSLAPCGRLLSMPGGQLFYYDCGGPESARPSGALPGDAEPADIKSAGVQPAGTNPSDAKPVLVFIHGLGDEADTWRHILPLLQAAGYRCLALDLPGFGRSLWQGRISVKGHAQAVIRLITETGAAQAGRPAVLIGSSMGCTIAELAAFRRPDLVRALVLLDGCAPMPASADTGLLRLALPGVGRRWYRAFRLNHDAAVRSLYAYYRDFDALPGGDKQFLRERVIARVESVNQERGYLGSLRSLISLFMYGSGAFSRGVRQFAGEILMLWGEHDQVMPVTQTALVRALRPDAAFRTVAGAGHLPQQEKPAQTAEEIVRFLREFSL